MTESTGRALTCVAVCLASAVGAYQNPFAFWVIALACLCCMGLWSRYPSRRPCPGSTKEA